MQSRPEGDLGAPPEGAIRHEPLYRKVKRLLVGRIAEGVWQPAQILPSEFQIAAELGVSQGTVRKALDEMAAEHLLVRQQGRGTFVASFGDDSVLFRFFKLRPDQGAESFPDSQMLSLVAAEATALEQSRLGLLPGARVWRLRRSRRFDGVPTISEQIVLSYDAFPGLDALESIPNNVYEMYSSRYGRPVGRVVERLKAVAASEEDAMILNCPYGLPLLSVDRVALDLSDRPLEWRISCCRTEQHHYLAVVS